MWTFQIITLFPERYEGYINSGLIKRAKEKKLIDFYIVSLLDFAIQKNKKRKIDDKPYGGGPGMILRIEPVDRALHSLPNYFPVIAMTPSGIPLNQDLLKKIYNKNSTFEPSGFTFISGYYEGLDQRILDHLVHYEISIGNFILNSGDPAILCFIDAFCRLIPGFLGKENSKWEESFEWKFNEKESLYWLEYPQYTKPRNYKGWEVPEVLLSGNHKMIERWRYKKSLEKTLKRKHFNF